MLDIELGQLRPTPFCYEVLPMMVLTTPPGIGGRGQCRPLIHGSTMDHAAETTEVVRELALGQNWSLVTEDAQATRLKRVTGSVRFAQGFVPAKFDATSRRPSASTAHPPGGVERPPTRVRSGSPPSHASRRWFR